jgi:hypothetical protein
LEQSSASLEGDGGPSSTTIGLGLVALHIAIAVFMPGAVFFNMSGGARVFAHVLLAGLCVMVVWARVREFRQPLVRSSERAAKAAEAARAETQLLDNRLLSFKCGQPECPHCDDLWRAIRTAVDQPV